MSTMQDVIEVMRYHKLRVEIFGITTEAAQEISALILGLGDQIATDNDMSNEEAAQKLPPDTELSEDAEIIFEEIKKRALVK